MRNPGGYGFVSSPVDTALHFDGRRREFMRAGVFETDTFTCAHSFCGGRVVAVKSRMDPADIGGLCKVCMKLICPTCVGRGCDPLEKALERAEARGIALRSYGL